MSNHGISFIHVNGTDGKYEISETGVIRSLYFQGKARHVAKTLKPGLSHGYLCVVFCIGGKRKTAYIHRLLAEHFLPNPNNLPVINHVDGNRSNNIITNLEWCTYSQNSQHGVDFLSNNHGSNHVKAKFKELDILKIIRMHHKLGNNTKSIADEFKVSQATIINICAGRRYKKEYAKVMATLDH